MHKSPRPRGTRQRQGSSQIPVRRSNNDQTHKTSFSTSGEITTNRSSNEEIVRQDIDNSRTASRTDEARMTVYQKNEESRDKDGVFIIGGLGKQDFGSSPRSVTSNNEYQQVCDIRAESDGEGVYNDSISDYKKTVHYSRRADSGGEGLHNEGTGKVVSFSRCGSDGEYNKTVYQMRADSDGEGFHDDGNSKNEESVVYTSRSDDGEITTVRQTFKIVGTIDKDNRSSKESLISNVDGGFHGSQDLLCNVHEGDRNYSGNKIMKSVNFEDVGSDNSGKPWIKPSNNIKLEMEQEVGEDEELLREELLRIFDRERLTLGSFFKNKMEDIVRDCRQRELDVEEHSRAEIADIENEMAREKAQMQKVFAEEIAALTRTFNEDRASMESYYKEQIKELREQNANDQKELNQKFVLEKAELKEKLESEFETVLRTEIGESRKMSLHEINQKEERYNSDRLEMERKHERNLHDAEMNTKKVKDELEMMFSNEKVRIEERMKDLEQQLLQEREMRIHLESLLEEEKENVKNVDNAKRSETDQLRSELEGLKVELDEKNRVTIEMNRIEEEIRTNGKNGLSGKLREDVDKIIDEHKQEFERKYLMDREELQKDKERQLEEEKRKIKDDVENEKRKIQDDVENERKKMKEEIDRERQEIQIYLKNGRSDKKDSREDSFTRFSEKSEYSTSISYGQDDKAEEKSNEYKDERQSNSYGTYNGYRDDTKFTVAKSQDQANQEYKDERQSNSYGTYNGYREDTKFTVAKSQDQANQEYKDGRQSNSYGTYNGYRDDTKFTVANSQDQANQEYKNGRQTKSYGSNSSYKGDMKSTDGNRKEFSSLKEDVQEKYGSFSIRGERHDSSAINESYAVHCEDGRETNTYNSEVSIVLQKPEGTRDDARGKYPDQRYEHQVNSRHTADSESTPNEDQWRYKQNYDYGTSTSQEIFKTDQYYVTPGNENDLRMQINQLRSENEGLKAKIGAMEENIDLHKKYKAEAKDELNRLQKTKDELQSRLDSGSKDEEEVKKAKLKADRLEKSLRESEARRKEFEVRIKELKSKLSDAESKAKQSKDTSDHKERKIRDHVSSVENSEGYKTKFHGGNDRYSKDVPNVSTEALESCPLYAGNSRFENQDKYGKSSKDTKHENVYGYPAEMSESLDFLDFKNREDQAATDSQYVKKESDLSWKNGDIRKGKYTKSSHDSSKSKYSSRPEMYSLSSTNPIQGSHEKLGRSDKLEKTGYDYGRYGSCGVGHDSVFKTSSPRKLDGRSYGNEVFSTKENIYSSTSSANKENYEKAVAERNTLVELIKQLKLKVEELYAEKQRIDKEESKMRTHSVGFKSFDTKDGLSSSEHADLKAKVEEMQIKIRELAERLKRDAPRERHISYDQNEKYTSRPSMRDIEGLQEKLQRTGDAISHNQGNCDPDVLLRIENEVKAIGELIKKHCEDYDQEGSAYRSDGDNVKMVQLQMEKQELEMKLSMAKEAMNDYVNRLSDKMEGLEESSALSDATLQELYERNAKLKETLKALEKGQQRSHRQNEELRHQTSALQNVIGQICKSGDTSFCSQYSSPRVTGSHGYSMTSHGHSRDMDISDRYRSY